MLSLRETSVLFNAVTWLVKWQAYKKSCDIIIKSSLPKQVEEEEKQHHPLNNQKNQPLKRKQ